MATVVSQQTALTEDELRQRDEFVGRLFNAFLGAIDVFATYLGDRLGYYAALAEAGPLTAGELARRTGTSERYAREWLEQQAVSGMLTVDDVGAEPPQRRYTLPRAHAEPLLDRDSTNYLAPLSRAFAAIGQVTPSLLRAYRSGGGVGWHEYGTEMREAQADVNRPVFFQNLAKEWLPAISDIDARLRADPPARIADVACGAGWSSIAIAQRYAEVRIDGFDLDEPSIALARMNAKAAGVSDRVRFHADDAARSGADGKYDLVTIFEALHDFSRPVDVLRTVRRLVGDGGSVLVMDERVAERFTAPGDEIERLMYGYSILCCLPNGLAEQPSAATGTVMRPETVRRYAREAGFREVEVLPIEHAIFRLYRLRL